MKNLNITISDEAGKRLKIYQAIKNLSNQSSAIDTILLEYLPAAGNKD